MKKHNGFISIQVIVLALLLIILATSLDKMAYRNRILISREGNILNKNLKSNSEEIIFLNKAITELNNLLEINKETFKDFTYENSEKKLSFSLEKDVFVLEEKIKNIFSKKISYYDYYIHNELLKLNKRRFYEFKE